MYFAVTSQDHAHHGDGKLGKGVTAKDIALYMMSKMTTSGATGYFVEYAGEAILSLTMEGRLTLCNLSIEMGARGGMIAPDEVTSNISKAVRMHLREKNGIRQCSIGKL